MARTIEQEYTARKAQAEKAQENVAFIESIIEGTCYKHLDYNPVLCSRVVAAMNDVAVGRWPATRAKLAQDGKDIPEGPAAYGTCGYTVKHGICASRPEAPAGSREHETILLAACKRVLPGLQDTAATTQASFESYRLAVAQGVAIPPSE